LNTKAKRGDSMKWAAIAVFLVLGAGAGYTIKKKVDEKRDPCERVREHIEKKCREANNDPSQLKRKMACMMVGLTDAIENATEDECRAVLEKWKNR
jgi:hypothetical protein